MRPNESATDLTAKVDANGRIFIPARVRQSLGLKPGDDLTLQVRVSDLVMHCDSPVARRTRAGGAGKRDARVDAAAAMRHGQWEALMPHSSARDRLDVSQVLHDLRRRP